MTAPVVSSSSINLALVREKIQQLGLYAYERDVKNVEFGKRLEVLITTAEGVFGPLIDRRVVAEKTFPHLPDKTSVISRSEPSLKVAAATAALPASAAAHSLSSPSPIEVAKNLSSSPGSSLTYEQIAAIVADTLKIIEEQNKRLQARKTLETKPKEWEELLQDVLCQYNAQLDKARALDGHLTLSVALKLSTEIDKISKAIDNLWREVETFHFCYVIGGVKVSKDEFRLYAEGSKTWYDTFTFKTAPKPLSDYVKTNFPAFLTLDSPKPLRKYPTEAASEAV